MLFQILLVATAGVGIILLIILDKQTKQLNEYKKLFSLGEVADRTTINIIKDFKKKEKGNEIILDDLGPIIEKKLYKYGFDLFSLVATLLLLNGRQWDLEDKVRSEKTAESCIAARKNNTLRVKIKNEINTLVGDEIEMKNYRGEEDDKEEGSNEGGTNKRDN